MYIGFTPNHSRDLRSWMVPLLSVDRLSCRLNITSSNTLQGDHPQLTGSSQRDASISVSIPTFSQVST